MSEDFVSIQLANQLPENRRSEFMLAYGSREKNPTLALILSLFLGGLGVDRFYVGHIGLGVLKLLTLGGFFIWAFVDLFLIMGAAKRENAKIARQVFDALGGSAAPAANGASAAEAA